MSVTPSQPGLVSRQSADSVSQVPRGGRDQREIQVKGWNDLNHIDWAADGKGFYVSSEMALATTLLYVDLDGNVTIVLRESGLFTETWGLPFPDGKHLAYLHSTTGNNAWMLENF
jgi:hypothetical protein